MNLFSSALDAAKGAYEYGASTVSAVSSKVQANVPISIPGVAKSTDGATGGGKDSARTKGGQQEIEEKKEEKEAEPEENFGKLEVKLDYSFDKSSLSINVIQGANLPAMDMGGTSDPYVKLYILPDKKKKFETKKHKKTLNPVFNETFKFDKLPFNEMSNKTLVFEVYDHDALGSDDQMGEIHLPLGNLDLASDNLQSWYDIKEPPKNVLGDICLSMRYKPQSKPAVLNVTVMECKNLKPMDLGGTSDPYVKINHMLDGKRVKKYKTPVKNRDLNPYYNQTFKIEIEPNKIHKNELHIFVMDFDKVGSNDAIGCLKMSMKDEGTPGKHWRSVINNPKKSIAQWHSLMPVEEEKK